MLSDDQVDYIRKVLKKRGIETIDLLEEMTDHFVQAIEEREDELPQLTLREALRQEVAKFGTFGMMKLQEDYQRKLEKEGLRILWRTFLSFWKIPQIMGSIAFLYATFLSIQFFGQYAVTFYRIAILALALVFVGVMIYYRYRLGAGNLAMYTKLHSSLHWIYLPVLVNWGNLAQPTGTDNTMTLNAQLIATALLGVVLLFQCAGALILKRSYAEVERQVALRQAK